MEMKEIQTKLLQRKKEMGGRIRSLKRPLHQRKHIRIMEDRVNQVLQSSLHNPTFTVTLLTVSFVWQSSSQNPTSIQQSYIYTVTHKSINHHNTFNTHKITQTYIHSTLVVCLL